MLLAAEPTNLHIQILNFSCTDFSPSIMYQIRYNSDFLDALDWFLRSFSYIPTNFCCKNAPKCNSHTLIDKKYYFGAKSQTILKISLTSIFGTKFVNFT